MPRVSIVVPYFNNLPYLEDCLRSLTSQTLRDWEAIVVDDGSTEGDAAAVVMTIGDSRIRVLRHSTNRGLAAARNTGFGAATASLILPLDGDDMLAVSCVADMVAEFEKNPSPDCVMCNFALFGAASEAWTHHVKPLGALVEHQWLPGAGVMMHRSLWVEVGGYCEAAELRAGNEDWDFWLAAATRGFRAAHTGRTLYHYRRYPMSMSLTLHARDHRTRKFIYRRHKVFFRRHGGARRFIAAGYWRAATATRRSGRRVAAVVYAAQAVIRDGGLRRFKQFLAGRPPSGEVDRTLPNSVKHPAANP